ncbi:MULTISPECIES: helix-turn-helix transcriptional regulator [Thermomonas]|jgi:transcriptional regulator with XRE-family HTH domain|uniref:Helix-turn-helix domain-containing protein n=1 Tax=Thermomonas beijingensis TaxID=2872701 RepID=A0ABS7TGE6_9GAMM|nr:MULTISPECIES: helix-turn-helix transcriptional regulator [Thermomonas]MBS0458861.1 helix-turn-helix transcriptional regulator [Pseudomonadota bacterium]MBZ4186898.1 helix-turn-helix domain-containing protein [Thermomonas beijingensis]HOC11694.1 helix-turn-helix transcriptional regulator [Thermomonas sp.]HQA02449.1 helix-turn-helix transcriptional regulator [Thermomonas sp.]HQE08373.1 helix-turn-helix transcriptional regulator [Thermomonas sp.]
MQTILELGHAIADRRRSLGLKQGDVARQAGVAQEMLSRLERGRCAEFGARKLLAIAAVLGLEVDFIETVVSGSLDDLRRERSNA